LIQNSTCIAVIPARGGSKGIPGKNLIKLGGKSLLEWTIEAAKGSQYLDRIILSSDSDQIINTAKELGCAVPFKRPDYLATDESPVSETLLHALDNINEKVDYLLLLQLTSPFRNSKDIDECIELCHENNAPAAISVTETGKPPEWCFKVNRHSQLEIPSGKDSIPYRRQGASATYVINGAVYVAKVDWFRENESFISSETLALKMPKERSLDIDDNFDLTIAQALAEQGFNFDEI